MLNVLIFLFIGIVAIAAHFGLALICLTAVDKEEWWKRKYNPFLLLPGVPEVAFIIVAIVVIYAFIISSLGEFFE